MASALFLGGGSHRQHHSSGISHSTHSQSVARDSHGKIARSESAKHVFLKEHGYSEDPAGCEVDHVLPLYAGGDDTPVNMQLLSTAERRVKTKSDFKKYGR